MVGACHLGSWNLYVPKFMDFYTTDPGDHFRFPTVQEAEQADRQAVREVFSRCYAGSTLDDALNTVAIERDMGIYRKPRPFNHIFRGDRILRA